MFLYFHTQFMNLCGRNGSTSIGWNDLKNNLKSEENNLLFNPSTSMATFVGFFVFDFTNCKVKSFSSFHVVSVWYTTPSLHSLLLNLFNALYFFNKKIMCFGKLMFFIASYSDGVFETGLGSRDTFLKVSSRTWTSSLNLESWSRKVMVLKYEKSRAGPLR